MIVYQVEGEAGTGGEGASGGFPGFRSRRGFRRPSTVYIVRRTYRADHPALRFFPNLCHTGPSLLRPLTTSAQRVKVFFDVRIPVRVLILTCVRRVIGIQPLLSLPHIGHAILVGIGQGCTGD